MKQQRNFVLALDLLLVRKLGVMQQNTFHCHPVLLLRTEYATGTNDRGHDSSRKKIGPLFFFEAEVLFRRRFCSGTAIGPPGEDPPPAVEAAAVASRERHVGVLGSLRSRGACCCPNLGRPANFKNCRQPGPGSGGRAGVARAARKRRCNRDAPDAATLGPGADPLPTVAGRQCLVVTNEQHVGVLRRVGSL
jgi:hypothetical protein